MSGLPKRNWFRGLPMMKIQGKTHRWFSNWWIRGESLCRIQTIGQVCCLLGNPQKTGTSSTDFITWLWRFPTFRMRRNSCLVLVVRTDTLTTPLRSRPIAGSGDPDKWDLRRVLRATRLRADGTSYLLDEPGLLPLYWCIRYITEARKKYIVFHKRAIALYKNLKRAFIKQGKPAEYFWQYYVDDKTFLDFSIDPEIEKRFKSLMPLIGQMTRLTAYFVRSLLDIGAVSLERLEGTFASMGVRFEGSQEFEWVYNKDVPDLSGAYNSAVERGVFPGLSIIKTKLPENVGKDASVAELMEVVRLCFGELRASLIEFCPEYPVVEGDFQYCPDATRRILHDGSIERVVRDLFVLTMDIVGSTDSPQTNEMKDHVISTFKRFLDKRVFFDTSGNDAFVAACHDPTVLWDIAKSIQTYGRMLARGGGRFDGTRKGLSFGTLAIVEGTDGFTG